MGATSGWENSWMGSHSWMGKYLGGEQLDGVRSWMGNGWISKDCGVGAQLEKVPHCPHANIWVKWGVGVLLNPTPNGICTVGVFCPIPQLDDPIQRLDLPGSVASSRASGSGSPHGAGERGWGCSGERSRGGGSTFTTH